MHQAWDWVQAGETETQRQRIPTPTHSLVGERGTIENVKSAPVRVHLAEGRV